MSIKRKCIITGREFEISKAEQEYLRRLNQLMPELGGHIPLPEIHPVEAMRRALCHGNYLFLFKRRPRP